MKKRATRNHYTPEQKAQIVLEVLNENQTIGQIASAYGIHVNTEQHRPQMESASG